MTIGDTNNHGYYIYSYANGHYVLHCKRCAYFFQAAPDNVANAHCPLCEYLDRIARRRGGGCLRKSSLAQS